MPMNKLSVVIIAFNEEESIARCITSVKGVADEIVVVDSFSTDKTKTIAEGLGARVIEHKFEGHIQQKNWAKDQAQYDWVLSIDADEALSEELREAIIKAKQNFTADGYYINRLNFYCGRPVKTCGWYPDAKARLWNRTKGQWAGTNPHDKFEMNAGAKTQKLYGDLLHYTYPTHQDLLNQVEKFANISAQQLKHKSTVYLIFKMLFSPGFKFIKNYFFNVGFTDGNTGFTICYHQAREVLLKYYRAIKLK